MFGINKYTVSMVNEKKGMTQHLIVQIQGIFTMQLQNYLYLVVVPIPCFIEYVFCILLTCFINPQRACARGLQ